MGPSPGSRVGSTAVIGVQGDSNAVPSPRAPLPGSNRSSTKRLTNADHFSTIRTAPRRFAPTAIGILRNRDRHRRNPQAAAPVGRAPGPLMRARRSPPNSSASVWPETSMTSCLPFRVNCGCLIRIAANCGIRRAARAGACRCNRRESAHRPKNSAPLVTPDSWREFRLAQS